jgi:hypothetical protein
MKMKNKDSDYGYFYDTDSEVYLNVDSLYRNDQDKIILQNKNVSIYKDRINLYTFISIISIFSFYAIIKAMFSYLK